MLSEGRGPERMARALMLVVAGWTVLGFVGGWVVVAALWGWLT